MGMLNSANIDTLLGEARECLNEVDDMWNDDDFSYKEKMLFTKGKLSMLAILIELAMPTDAAIKKAEA